MNVNVGSKKDGENTIEQTYAVLSVRQGIACSVCAVVNQYMH